MKTLVIRYAFYVDLQGTGDWDIAGPGEKQTVLEYCHRFWEQNCDEYHAIENSSSTQGDGFLCFFLRPDDIVNAALAILNKLEADLIRRNPMPLLLIRPRITLLLAHMSIRNENYRTASSDELNNTLPVEREIGEVGRIAMTGELYKNIAARHKTLFEYIKTVTGKRGDPIKVYRTFQKANVPNG